MSKKFLCRAVAVSLFLVLTAVGKTLAGSPVHVRGDVRSNGTYVAPHYRSSPDGNFQNNWSTKGNFNPYTGAAGTRVTPPVASGGYRPSYSTPAYSPPYRTPGSGR